MPLRVGPGPVFIHESVAATRRWQLYALRALFVLGLLLALAFVLCGTIGVAGTTANSYPIQRLARLGENFYYAIATVQLGLVLLVAPAATAGAICVDRARGALAHMLVTDLSDSEIVLGKLAAAPSGVCCGRRHGTGSGTRGASGWHHHRGDRHADADHARGGDSGLCTGTGVFGPRDQGARSLDGGVCNRGRLDRGSTRLVPSGRSRSLRRTS